MVDDISGLPFVLPLRFEKDYSIVDATKRVICPCIIYKSDKYHIEKQTRAGEEMVEIINNKHGWFRDDKDEWKSLGVMATENSCPTAQETKLVEAGNGGEKKHRGNPAWIKGMKKVEGCGRKKG